MKALIVAAGLSSRLRPITDTLPKGLLPVAGKTLLGRSVDLLGSAGVEEIVVVVGYRKTQIQEHLGARARYVHNPFYAQTNNMGSLWFGIQTMRNDPFLYLHSDIIFDPLLLQRMLDQAPEHEASLLVDFGPVDEEAMKVSVADGRFEQSSKAIPFEDAVGEWVGMASFSSEAAGTLWRTTDDLLGEGEFQAYDTVAFNRTVKQGLDWGLVATEGLSWSEIDTPQDLENARAVFQNRVGDDGR
jgi:choline kinase